MKTKKGVEITAEFAKALRGDAKARAAFDAMPPSHQRAYAEVIAEAKKPETRQRRIAGAMTMILEWGAARAKKSPR